MNEEQEEYNWFWLQSRTNNKVEIDDKEIALKLKAKLIKVLWETGINKSTGPDLVPVATRELVFLSYVCPHKY